MSLDIQLEYPRRGPVPVSGAPSLSRSLRGKDPQTVAQVTNTLALLSSRRT